MNESFEGEDKKPEIRFTEKEGAVFFHDLDLSKDSPNSPEITITVKKQPVYLREGDRCSLGAVIIDKETDKMKSLADQAEKLVSLPERERLSKILEILRSHVDYPYENIVVEISKKDPELAQWITENVGLRSNKTDIPLSEIFEKKYGICRHLAPAYLWLAQKAGLQGVILTCDHKTIKNIQRTDNGERLFKSAEVDQLVDGHAWVEIKLSDGVWVPVDPSTKLVGDTEESFEMFKRASYRGFANVGIDVDSEVKELHPRGVIDPFEPGEEVVSGNFHLVLASSKPTLVIGPKTSSVKEPKNTSYRGRGILTIKTETPMTKLSSVGLSIQDIKEKT